MHVRKKEKKNEEHKDRLRTRGTTPVRRNPWDQARREVKERKREKKEKRQKWLKAQKKKRRKRRK